MDKITVVDEEKLDELYYKLDYAIGIGASEEVQQLIEAEIELAFGATVH